MNQELTNILSELEATADDAKKVFGNLNNAQINWKPNAESWSVGQCLDHLIVTNEKEFPAIEDALTENYRNPFWSRMPFLPKFFGNLIANAVKPESVRKYKAPKSFQPLQGSVNENIVEDFLAHQQKLVQLFERSKNLDLMKTKIVSPVTDFVTYSLFDAFRILVVHEQRHFQQAKRVMRMEGFPS